MPLVTAVVAVLELAVGGFCSKGLVSYDHCNWWHWKKFVESKKERTWSLLLLASIMLNMSIPRLLTRLMAQID
jgi:hypothetical protein